MTIPGSQTYEITELWWSAFGKFIAECYGLPEMVICEARNDSYHKIDLLYEEFRRGRFPTEEEYGPGRDRALENGNVSVDTHEIDDLMEDMAVKGFIPRGIYLLRVSW